MFIVKGWGAGLKNAGLPKKIKNECKILATSRVVGWITTILLSTKSVWRWLR